MSVRPMIASLRFSRLTVFFLVLETTLACAFLCNAFAFIAHQAAPMLAPDGVAPGEVLFANQINFPFGFDDDGTSTGGANPADLQVLEARVREMSGVKAVSLDLGMPYTHLFPADGRFHARNGRIVAPASMYSGENLVHALGLELLRGRNFDHSDVVPITLGNSPDPQVGIITQALAQRLFPDRNALGKHIVWGKAKDATDVVVVGIVRHLPSRQPTGGADDDAAVLLPAIPGTGFPMASLVVRTQPGARAAVAGRLPDVIRQTLHLKGKTADKMTVRTFEAIRSAYFRPNRSTIWLMLGVTLAVVAITVIGIMGLTGFWVQRRTRQIGIRRALGATRGQILRYFMLENLLVVGAGVVLGVIAAYAGNLWLMSHLEIPRLPWTWLPIGAAALCVLGQLAVLAPSRRAANVPPVVATRSV